jgi:hypothetical protein
MSYASTREPADRIVALVDATAEGDSGRLTGVALSIPHTHRHSLDPRHGYRARSVLEPPDGPPSASTRRSPMA